VHEEHLARQRRGAVNNALSVLGSSLDYEWTLAAVTRLLVPVLADYCSVDLVDSGGTLRRVSVTHTDPVKEAVLREMWTRYPYQPGDGGAPHVVETGEMTFAPDLDPVLVAQYARTPEQREMLEQLSPRSFLCLPMIARGVTFGALSLVYSDSGRRHGVPEIAAAEEIARRAATAIENARLYTAAQAASRAKSDFLATMSHELRTPLNAIAGYTDLLSLGVRGAVNDEQQRDLGRIRQNQQHLLEIITDILSFSRMEAGAMRYSIEAVPLADVLGRMEAVIEPQARVRELTYEYHPPDEKLVALADREKLEQILINLLGNAVKFTPVGGQITLVAEGDASKVRVHVRDSGIGIEAQQLASIFEPFVQLEPALTRTNEGTGLGLAIGRELARGMGGELRAVSTPGVGSVFTVELPRAS
jgi:signal transduction histidine kinase